MRSRALLLAPEISLFTTSRVDGPIQPGDLPLLVTLNDLTPFGLDVDSVSDAG